jgi:hypothetical protein
MSTKSATTYGSVGKRRIITLEDYEAEAKSFSGVIASRAYNWGDGYSLGIADPFIVYMVVMGVEGALSSFVKKGLKEYLDSIALEGVELTLIDPVFKRVDVSLLCNIGQYRGTIFESEIYQNIRLAIKDYLSLGNIEIGTSVNSEELLSVIIKSDLRIRFLEYNRPITYYPLPNEVPILGNLFIEFNVEMRSKYDLGYLFDRCDVGPFVVDSLIAENYLKDLWGYLYVVEDIYWDWYSPDVEYFEKEFLDDSVWEDIAQVLVEYFVIDSVVESEDSYIDKSFNVVDICIGTEYAYFDKEVMDTDSFVGLDSALVMESASAVVLLLDTLPPQNVQVLFDGRLDPINEIIQIKILTSDFNVNGYMMKIWGDVNPAYNPDIGVSEVDSSWIPYNLYKVIDLGYGSPRRIYVKMKDDVGNEADVVVYTYPG